MNKLFIEPSFIIGKTFTVGNDTTEYECVGYAANETFLIVGRLHDSVNNRFTFKTVKLQDAKFLP